MSMNDNRLPLKLLWALYSLQSKLIKKLKKSLFGFGPGCDIEFELDKSQTRKSIQVVDHSNNDNKKSKQLIYYDGEDVSGTVSIEKLTFLTFPE